jgi:hypothetical protein
VNVIMGKRIDVEAVHRQAMASPHGDPPMVAALSGDRVPALNPVCTFCRHLRGVRRCDAFPADIPLAIWIGHNDHRLPVASDHGIRFEPLTDEQVARLRAHADDSDLLEEIHGERAPVAR